MNMLGLIRGMMSKNMSDYDFFSHVTQIMGAEFEVEVTPVFTDCFYGLKFMEHTVILDKQLVNTQRLKGSFALDRFIYKRLEKQGFKIDKHGSQYIRYCFGVFYKRDDGSLY